MRNLNQRKLTKKGASVWSEGGNFPKSFENGDWGRKDAKSEKVRNNDRGGTGVNF